MAKSRFALFIILLTLLPAAYSLTISPIEYNIKEIEFDKTYNFVLTVIQDRGETENVNMVVDADSFYLEDYAEITPSSFRISPDEKKNVKISLTVPSSLSPEQHILNVRPLVEGSLTPAFSIKFSIPGEQIHKLEITNIEIDDGTQDLPLNFEIKLKNDGNVIARGSPIIKIMRDSQLIDTFGEKSSVMVLPGKTYNFSVLYDARDLSLGEYTAEIYFDYNTRKTATVSKNFEILSDVSEDINSKTIVVGESVDVTVLLQYEKSSPYRLKAIVEDQEIEAEKDGTIVAGQQNEVEFSLDTSALEPGTYNIVATIEYGDNYQEKLTKEISLVVKKERNVMQLVMIAAGIIILIGYLISYFILRNPEKAEITKLNKRLIRVKGRLDTVEQQTKSAIADISKMVEDSNRFFKEQGTNYEFK